MVGFKSLKSIYVLLFALCMLSFQAANAQTVQYGPIQPEDHKAMLFSILGKTNNRYLVYKQIQRKKFITSYSENLKDVRTTLLPINDVGFLDLQYVSYPNKVILFYQRQHADKIYCDALIIDEYGKLIAPIRSIDSTAASTALYNKVYNISFSEDRSKILLYKTIPSGSTLKLEAKLLNASLETIENLPTYFVYDDHIDDYRSVQVSNNGTVFFLNRITEFNSIIIKNISAAQYYPFSKIWIERPLGELPTRIVDPFVKIDNTHDNILIASWSVSADSKFINGMICSRIPLDTLKDITIAKVNFNDATKKEATSKAYSANAFNSYYITQVLFRKDGSFSIIAEDQMIEARVDSSRFDRNTYDPIKALPNERNLYYRQFFQSPNPYNIASYDVNEFTKRQIVQDKQQLYFSRNLAVFFFNDQLISTGKTFIQKSQLEKSTANHLSSFVFPNAAALQVLYVAVSSKPDILHINSVDGNGEIYQRSTLKNGEKGYAFMPAYARQVEAQSILMPTIRRNKISFAKISF